MEWESRTAAKGKRKECPVDILEEMMREEKWKNIRAKVVKEDREIKNRGEKFYKMEEVGERVNEKVEEEEVITISSSDEEIEDIILSSGEEEETRVRQCQKCRYLTNSASLFDIHQRECKTQEEETRVEKKAERCQLCRSYGCRGAETARQCQKCGYLTLKCQSDRHRRWCKTH